MRLPILLTGVLTAAPALALDLPAEEFTLDSFVAWAAPRMEVSDLTLTVYTAEEVSRRCLNYMSGAFASPELTQEIVAAGQPFTINEEQLAALVRCAGEEGYLIE